MAFSLVLDIVIAVLLVVTIGYAVILNRRLGSLRRNKEELETLAANFGEATARAGENIVKLRNTADQLQARMDKAQALRDDLAFLIDRGGSSADRLEDAVRAARSEEGVMPMKAKAAPVAETDKPAQPVELKADTRAVIESRADAKSKAKSKAERELLRALQAAR